MSDMNLYPATVVVVGDDDLGNQPDADRKQLRARRRTARTA